jgi:hypothetical protein
MHAGTERKGAHVLVNAVIDKVGIPRRSLVP